MMNDKKFSRILSHNIIIPGIALPTAKIKPEHKNISLEDKRGLWDIEGKKLEGRKERRKRGHLKTGTGQRP